MRAEIDELFAADREVGAVLEDVARAGARLLLQAALEAEVTEFLGRERYARGGRRRAGHRNGYAPVTVKTTAGPVTLERPKLRGSPEAFASRLLGKGVTRTNALESLVIAGFVRGLSVRDVEHTLAEALGPEATLAKSTVARICAALQAEFATWQQRALHGLELDYLYLDATAFKMHPASRRAEPLLCAWGITTDGGKVLVGLAAGGAESYENWLDFLRRLRAGGLRPPLLGVSDGAPGLIRAFQEVFDRSLHQRCLVHKARNVLAKVPKAAQAEVKAALGAIFDGVEAPAGEAAVAAVRDRARAFGQRYQRLYPAAVACLLDDLPSLTTHLRFPAEHWRRIRPHQPVGANLRGVPPAGQGDRPAAERGNLRLLGLGRARPHERRLAWPAPNPAGHPPAARSAPPALRKPGGRSKGGGVRGVSYVLRSPRPPPWRKRIHVRR